MKCETPDSSPLSYRDPAPMKMLMLTERVCGSVLLTIRAGDVPVVSREERRMVLEEAQDASLPADDVELSLESLRGGLGYRTHLLRLAGDGRTMVAPLRCRSGVCHENECTDADE